MEHLPWETEWTEGAACLWSVGVQMDPGEVDTKGCSPLVRWTLKEMQPGRRAGRVWRLGSHVGGVPALNLQFPVWWILQHLDGGWHAVGTQE